MTGRVVIHGGCPGEGKGRSTAHFLPVIVRVPTLQRSNIADPSIRRQPDDNSFVVDDVPEREATPYYGVLPTLQC